MMVIDALIPVRAAGKERLAGVLTPHQRAVLVRAMLTDVVTALHRCPFLRTVAVVSPDAAILALAAELGTVPIGEPPGAGGLNGALAVGLAHRAAAGAEGVLIVPGDLPQMRADDIAALLTNLPAAPCVRAVPAADGGTGALLLCPPGIIAPAFGPDSFARHAAAAHAAGATFERLEPPSLLRDVDRPQDLIRVLAEAGKTCTARALRGMGFHEADLASEHPGDGAAHHRRVRA
jgi:2-phospho-L-lactate guanylyltransferase